MTATTSLIRVDIVSDVVCPWCVIGYYQLAAAARQVDAALHVHWHPFELNPEMPSEGENLREHLAAKYGTTPEGSIKARARLTALGKELGFTFAYADDMRMWSTFRAHQLLDWAEPLGKGHALQLALFAAYFTDRMNLSDIDTLASVAGRVGLDVDAARQALVSGARAEAVRSREQTWLRRGVTGVPAMIFAGEVAVVGAQGVEAYASILQQLRRKQAAA